MRLELNNHNSSLIDAANQYGQAAYLHSKLPLRIFEAARIATAVINGCMICKNWRTAVDASRYGIEGGVTCNGEVPDEAFYQTILSGDYSNLSKKEQLAIEYAQGMGKTPQALAQNEEFWERFKQVFSDDEIVDLSYCVSAWMGLGRIAHVLGADTACSL